MTNVLHIPTWTLGDRLSKARQDAGLTVVDMAALLGTSRQTIHRYESDSTGKRGVPRTVLITWAAVTNVPIQWLVGLPLTDAPTSAPTSEYGAVERIVPGHGPPGRRVLHRSVGAA
jgi:transcriptional regulator with XRE-family HTH domain